MGASRHPVVSPTPRGLIASCVAKPGKSKPSWHFRVLLFDSFKAMYNYSAWAYGNRSRNYRAICYTHSHDDNDEMKAGCLGTILFCIKDFTHELVSHESSHAVLSWWRQINGEALYGSAVISSSSEEAIATAIGGMTLQIEMKLAQYRPKVDLGE